MSDLTEHLNAGTLKAVHTAKMTAASVVEGIKVLADPLHLDEIPGAMDKMGWEVSAKLMRRWFAGRPAYVMPSELRGGENGHEPIDYAALPSAQIESKIVKMRWLLKFEPVVSVFEDLVRNWNNVLSMDRIRRLLAESAGWAPGRTAALGSGLLHAWELDQRASVNFRTFGQYHDVMDDLYGAIFRANLKIAVVGKTRHSWVRKTDVLEVEKLGVYMRDTYDFNSSAITDAVIGLGVWSRDRVLNKSETIDYRTSTRPSQAVKYPGFVSVSNADFRRWQNKHNTGGDYFVFSDVMWISPHVDYVVL